jgi:hypothetical protein
LSTGLQANTRNAFPKQWAEHKQLSAMPYKNRIECRAENLDSYNRFLYLALQDYTRDAFLNHGSNTNNLATAYNNARIEVIGGDTLSMPSQL